ncbi:MAG TPA: ribosome biogenesis GTPase YlqF [Bacillota bacterium]|nr:ribosome biogenesis GTPase YlqF [Bacillota bacterium]HOH10297.1 ribosome biogenesis GTPase YlqF [Bacillota bacterium]HOY88938.1 ribosome biogenesis GTPase YlqF [Bacillota bacterium]HPI01696.1 ribosome biogenesis GTPase YlqF [Bacillota bacterium]HPM63888.1 ribosome biogenesis GTPase YlqF [Bacillota bacterium]
MAHSWYPGHMAKTVKEIKPLLKIIDVVIELVDARAPMSSSNPLLGEISSRKPSIVLLNKADLADQHRTELWLRNIRGSGRKAFATNAEDGTGISNAMRAISAVEGNARTRPRALIVGMPNVGKSSLINRLAKKASAKTGDKPGITRSKQWIDIGNAELLDTPGIMPLRVDDPLVWFKLCALGIIGDDLFEKEKVARDLLEQLSMEYPGFIAERYSVTESLQHEGQHAVLEEIALKKGCIMRGGIPDLEKASLMVIKDFRSGRIGRISLESV